MLQNGEWVIIQTWALNQSITLLVMFALERVSRWTKAWKLLVNNNSHQGVIRKIKRSQH